MSAPGKPGDEGTPRSGLAARLRAETRDLHTLAERAGMMPALLRGQVDRGTYCALLRNLHAVYAALEPALLRRAGHGVIGPVVFPALFRQAALAADLQALHGSGWDAWPLQPAAAAYVQRLQQIDAESPELLVAHAYVRSLGDLSGGQLLRRIVAQGLALDGEAGTRFYAFGSAADVATHLRAFRAALDALPADEACQDAIVAEARSAFERHAALFVQLDELRRGAPRPG